MILSEAGMVESDRVVNTGLKVMHCLHSVKRIQENNSPSEVSLNI